MPFNRNKPPPPYISIRLLINCQIPSAEWAFHPITGFHWPETQVLFFLAAVVPTETVAGPPPAPQNVHGWKGTTITLGATPAQEGGVDRSVLCLALLRSFLLPSWFRAPKPLFPSTLLKRKSNERLWSSFPTFYRFLDYTGLKVTSLNLQSRSYRLHKIQKRSQKRTSKHVSSLTVSERGNCEAVTTGALQANVAWAVLRRSNAKPLTCGQCCCGYQCWSLDGKNTSRKDI